MPFDRPSAAGEVEAASAKAAARAFRAVTASSRKTTPTTAEPTRKVANTGVTTLTGPSASAR